MSFVLTRIVHNPDCIWFLLHQHNVVGNLHMKAWNWCLSSWLYVHYRKLLVRSLFCTKPFVSIMVSQGIFCTVVTTLWVLSDKVPAIKMKEKCKKGFSARILFRKRNPYVNWMSEPNMLLNILSSVPRQNLKAQSVNIFISNSEREMKNGFQLDYCFRKRKFYVNRMLLQIVPLNFCLSIGI